MSMTLLEHETHGDFTLNISKELLREELPLYDAGRSDRGRAPKKQCQIDNLAGRSLSHFGHVGYQCFSGDPDEFRTKAFTFHTVDTSRTGYVRNESTMQEIKLAANEYIKEDIQDRNRQEFTNARIFISGSYAIDYRGS